MVLRFLPGEPNRSPGAVASANWNLIQILAYCSGNNLVLLTNDSVHLQTIYLPSDSFVVDINKVNGKLAIAIENKVLIYSPTLSNFYEFNFSGGKDVSKLQIAWSLEKEIINEKDDTTINCINWSDSCDSRQDELHSNQVFGLPDEYNTETSCELVVGSNKSLTLWRLFYRDDGNGKSIHERMLWFANQPNPVYIVKFSPSSNVIASVGYYDKLVKIWHRVAFGIESSEFELSYIPHSSYVTHIRWRINTSSDSTVSNTVTGTPSFVEYLKTSNSLINSENDLTSVANSLTPPKEHNILYTVDSMSYLNVHVFSYIDRVYKSTCVGNMDLYNGIPLKARAGKRFALILDNSYVDAGLRKLLDSFEEEEITTLSLENSAFEPSSKRGRSNSSYSSYQQKEEMVIRSLELKPELCMIIDENGNVDLYAICDIGSVTPVPVKFIKLNRKVIGGVCVPVSIKFGKSCLPSDCSSIFFQDFLLSPTKSKGELSLAIHDMSRNSVRQVEFSFRELFEFGPDDSLNLSGIGNVSSSQGTDTSSSLSFATSQPTVFIGQLQNKFTGHNKSIRKLIHSLDGSSFLSTTRFCESSLWSPIPLPENQKTLNKKSSIITPSPIKNAVIWKNGEYVITLVDKQIMCFDCRLEVQENDETVTKKAPICGKIELERADDPLSFLLLPESQDTKCHVLAIYRDKKAYAWNVSLDETEHKISLVKCVIDDIPNVEESSLYIGSAADPVGWVSSFGIDQERSVFSSITEEGFVTIYSVRFHSETDLKWELKYSFNTGIKNSRFIMASSINKLAIVGEDYKTLTIWDTKYSTLEFSETSEKKITDLDWTCTDYKQSILAVGHTTYVSLYTQLRFDYTNDSPVFKPIKEIDISSQTSHEIGDSIWMSDGLLVIGAGNQFYINDKQLNPEEDKYTLMALGTTKLMSNDIFHLCSALNGPLPIYHPQFIIQCLFLGRFKLVESILVKLSQNLREYDLSNDEKSLDQSLGFDDYHLLRRDSIVESTSNASNSRDNVHALFQVHDTSDALDQQTVDIISEKLQKYKLPYLTGHQQITLRSTIEIVHDITSKYKLSLDKFGLKFFVGMKLFQLNTAKKVQQVSGIKRRDISFAVHSESKDILLSLIKEQSGMRLTWKTAKMFGLAFWLSQETLKDEFEKIAKNEFFMYSEENNGAKDPSNCSIFYLALKKKTVLLGLWKTSTSNSEKAKMVKFLSNNFAEKRWKSAALKNGFVLLSKHRYMDAACFFLLADSLKDCVNVLIKQVKDLDLAIAVARCYEGSNDGPVLRAILFNHVLPLAVEECDRWTISWAFYMMGEKYTSVQILIKPLSEVLQLIKDKEPNFTTDNDDQVASIDKEDPVTFVVYGDLRTKHPKLFNSFSASEAKDEFSAALRAISMYERMGCDFISLYLLKNWTFTSVESAPKIDKKSKNKHENKSILPSAKPEVSNGEGVVKDTVSSKRIAPPVSAFTEPDMSAFDFGF